MTRAEAFQIQVALGSAWTISTNPDGDQFTFTHDNGYGFDLCESDYPKGRTLVHGVWPKAPGGYAFGLLTPYDLGVPSPGITVATNKSPQQKAKDVLRRFLPVYLPIWHRAVAAAAEKQKRQDATKWSVGIMVQAGGRHRDWRSAVGPQEVYLDNIGTAEVNCSLVSLNLYGIEAEHAAQVIALIRSFPKVGF